MFIFAAVQLLRSIRRLFLMLGGVFLVGTLLQLSMLFFRKTEPVHKDPDDHFDPALSRLNSMDRLIFFVDSLAEAKGIRGACDAEQYAELADSVLRMRFYHGLQNYRFSENFIANLSGKYLWSHFGAKVDPEHILKGQKAFCSQSSIVFQELLKRKGFRVRTIRLAGHFCTEVLINGNWGFFDVSYKPRFSDTPRFSTEQLSRRPQTLEEAYQHSFKKDFLLKLPEHFDPARISYGQVNEFPARRMLLFHRITRFFGWFGWIVFWGLAMVLRRVQKKG